MLLGLAFRRATARRSLDVPMPALATRVLHRVGSLVEGPAFYPFLTGPTTWPVTTPPTGRPTGQAARARIEEALDQVGLLVAAKKRYPS